MFKEKEKDIGEKFAYFFTYRNEMVIIGKKCN